MSTLCELYLDAPYLTWVVMGMVGIVCYAIGYFVGNGEPK